jgi:hypothetical protein
MRVALSKLVLLKLGIKLTLVPIEGVADSLDDLLSTLSKSSPKNITLNFSLVLTG